MNLLLPTITALEIDECFYDFSLIFFFFFFFFFFYKTQIDSECASLLNFRIIKRKGWISVSYINLKKLKYLSSVSLGKGGIFFLKLISSIWILKIWGEISYFQSFTIQAFHFKISFYFNNIGWRLSLEKLQVDYFGLFSSCQAILCWNVCLFFF